MGCGAGSLGCGVWGFKFRGLGFGVQGFEFRVFGFRFWASKIELRISGSELWVYALRRCASGSVSSSAAEYVSGRCGMNAAYLRIGLCYQLGGDNISVLSAFISLPADNNR